MDNKRIRQNLKWAGIEDFVQQISDARTYDEVHYCTSTGAGTAIGNKIAELARQHYLLGRDEGKIW
ncbi:MAG: hypothetical protein ACI88A_003883 [Paraglaciecola sp.]|jgi:hypothetical protein